MGVASESTFIFGPPKVTRRKRNRRIESARSQLRMNFPLNVCIDSKSLKINEEKIEVKSLFSLWYGAYIGLVSFSTAVGHGWSK